jgi:hypothetical protein
MKLALFGKFSNLFGDRSVGIETENEGKMLTLGKK